MATFADPIRSGGAAGPGPERPAERTKPFARFMHGLLLSAAFLIFAWPIVLPSGLVAGAVAAFVGVYVAEHLVMRRYRLPVILVGAGAALGLGAALVRIVVGSQTLAATLSPTNALQLAEVLRWAAVAFCASVALRATAIRYRAALAVEGSIVVLAVATTVAAHRDGMIARPLEVSDWFWTQGIDPVAAFLGIGLCAAVLLAGVLAYGRSGRRTIVQLGLVMILGLFLASRIHGRDQDTPKKNPIGEKLDGKKNKEKKKQAGGGGGNADGQKDDKQDPFKDDMPKNGSGSQNKPSAVVVFFKDVEPLGGVFYFRHGAFSQFNGVRLIEASRADVDQEARHGFPAVEQRVPGPQHEAKGRTAVATSVALLTHHSRAFALSDPIEVAPTPNPEPARFRRAYRVVSNVVVSDYAQMLGDAPGDPTWSDDVWEHYTEVPRDERYHRLATELQRGLRQEYQGDPIAQAITVKQYLEKEATYSFVRNYDGSDDPTAEFLFSDDKRGYCVHLAHSAAYLLRAMGVPARVSAGYAVPAKNLAGGSALLIKNGDAHAWAEIYLEGYGWVPVEVTPEKTDVKPREFSERDLQQLLGEMARKEGRHERATYEGPKLSEILAQIAELIPYVLLGLLALAYLIKLWRLIAPALSSSPRTAYRAGLDRLSASGLFRVHGEPRERFAARLAADIPSLTPLTKVVVASALGSLEPRKGAGESLGLLARRVGAEVRKTVPLWRWMIGVLNPVSWMWSR